MTNVPVPATPVEAVVREQFDAFYHREFRGLVRLAMVLVDSQEQAEEVVQDAFATAYRRWSEVAAYDDPLAWVRKVMVNNAMSRGRRLRREVLALRRFGGRPSPVPSPIDAPDQELWTLVSTLPKQQAAAIALHYVDDLSIESIATVLGCSTGSVKTHLSRGRHTLASRLTSLTKKDDSE